ncbi:MAG: hypothetical protein QOJ16_4722 [Acidobacteriota bacterium]|nr:hypothetical protein [Acidobacteriota bacterium]
MASPGQDEATALARAALGRELGVGESDAGELIRAEPVDWPNPSLGCPRKGMVYLQVVTPGWRLTFRVEGREWRVHVGGGRAIVCP